jgi:hypothetical protein
MADVRTLKRLLDNMRSEVIAGALQEAEWTISGSKDERIGWILEAVFAGDIAFAEVLKYAYKDALSSMCEELDLHKSGTRDILIERISDWFDKEFGHRVADDADDKEERDEEVDTDALGQMTVAVARAEIREADIATVTGLSEEEVREALENVHGKTLVRNVFDEHWPSEEELPSEEEREREEVGLQGRPEHRKMQKSLVDLGSLRRFHVRTNHAIGAGFKPDVLWFRLNPEEHVNAAPVAVFEIEFGSAQAIAKSLSSLKHAFDLGAHNLFLILPSSRVDGAKLRLGGTAHKLAEAMLGGAFHEIADALTVLPIEDTIELNFVELANRIGL